MANEASIGSKIVSDKLTILNSPKFIEKQIQTFQNKQLRRCLGLTPFTPNNPLHLLPFEPPAKYGARLFSVKGIIKV